MNTKTEMTWRPLVTSSVELRITCSESTESTMEHKTSNVVIAILHDLASKALPANDASNVPGTALMASKSLYQIPCSDSISMPQSNLIRPVWNSRPVGP